MHEEATILEFEAIEPAVAVIEGASLLLDLDGTLLDLRDRPDEVVADQAVRNLLARLARRLDERLAIISGRSIEQIDQILGPVADALAISGSHGCEHRWNGVLARPARPASLDRVAERMRQFAESHDGVILEEKTFGVALHFRMNPATAADATALAAALADELELGLQRGKMMVELRVAGGDKGKAVHWLMGRPPMRGTRPVFVGDDETDEPAFEAAKELGGHGVLIGSLRPTAAEFRIGSPADLRAWLARLVE